MKEIYENIRENIFSEEFTQYFRDNIQEYSHHLKNNKIFYIACMVFTLILTFALSIAFTYHLYLNGEDLIFCFPLFAVLLLVFFIFCDIFIKCYKINAKKIILPILLSFFGKCEFINNKNIKKTIDSRIFNMELIKKEITTKNIYSNCLTCIYGNNVFQITEAKLAYEFGDRRDLVFHGQIITFKSSKEIIAKTILKNKKARIKNINKQIWIDNPNFKQHFIIETEKPEEAKTLISEEFMNGLLSLNNEKLLENLTISFNKECINIAINSKTNLFDLAFFKKINDINNYRNILLNFAIILTIIEFINKKAIQNNERE